VHYLYLATIYPIELLIEFLYTFFYYVSFNKGFSIIALSITVNLLLIPIYHFAESIQHKERLVRNDLEPKIQRIKSVFKGDEQYMMLTTLYKQNNYRPIFILRGTLGLVIQVPFFIAAYKFLSNLTELHGESFLFIKNLSSSDGLLKFGGISINFLPLLMTLINIIAGIIYTKDLNIREKLQMHLMSAFFLFLLYQSPASLVLYWTFNNIFSLIKNCIYRLKKPAVGLYWALIFVSLVSLIIVLKIRHDLSSIRKLLMILVVFIIAFLPFIIKGLKSLFLSFSKYNLNDKEILQIFFISILLICILQGLFIPSLLISTSPIDFAFTGYISNPLNYILFNTIVFIGIWLLWGSFIYVIASKKVRICISLIAIILASSIGINIFLFSGDYGFVSNLLRFENPNLLKTNSIQAVLPIIFSVVSILILFVLFTKEKLFLIKNLFVILLISTLVASTLNILSINKEYKEHILSANSEDLLSKEIIDINPLFSLSKNGENIIFIFLDMGASSFFRLALQEIPELENQLSGFTFYPNTVSFGSNTLLGAPAMYGGYEYTPDEINKRDTEKLVDKHNESLLILPLLFSKEGYSSIITDPVYSNYKSGADHTPFNKFPEIKVYHIGNKYLNKYKTEKADYFDEDFTNVSTIIKKRLPAFSIFKSIFPIMRSSFYLGGKYFQSATKEQATDSFVGPFSMLYYLRELTSFEEQGDVFLSISNQTPHRPFILNTPQFEPRSELENSGSLIDNIKEARAIDKEFYHANVAALKRVGLWIQFLKDNDVYDNSRIIIVSDHSNLLYSEKMSHFTQNKYRYNSFNSLLLFKDFNSNQKLKIDNSFMTVADAPLLAIEDIIKDAKNPFTNINMYNRINKDIVNVYSGYGNPEGNSKKKFETYNNESFSVKENIFIETNWGSVIK
jgi:YidC/Oxa1 family membrane protein insertase